MVCSQKVNQPRSKAREEIMPQSQWQDKHPDWLAGKYDLYVGSYLFVMSGPHAGQRVKFVQWCPLIERRKIRAQSYPDGNGLFDYFDPQEVRPI